MILPTHISWGGGGGGGNLRDICTWYVPLNWVSPCSTLLSNRVLCPEGVKNRVP